MFDLWSEGLYGLQPDNASDQALTLPAVCKLQKTACDGFQLHICRSLLAVLIEALSSLARVQVTISKGRFCS